MVQQSIMEDEKMEKSPEVENFQQQVTELREWLEQKPYVPKNVEEKLYRRFIHSCYYDFEKAKTAADLFFSMRATSPELLTDRDLLSPHMQKILKITKFCRYRLSGNKNFWLWQLNDPGLRNYDHLLEAKMFILFGDSWLLGDDFLEEENIVVTDVKDMSLRLFTKFSYSVAKKLSKYYEEAVPIRLKQVHMVNAPGIINRVFSLFKPFLSKEMMDMIHIHTAKSTTLYDFISKDDLPEEFGGTRGKLADHFAVTLADIMKNREYLFDDNFWRIDPNARIKEKEISKPNATTEISSLRTLAID